MNFDFIKQHDAEDEAGFKVTAPVFDALSAVEAPSHSRLFALRPLPTEVPPVSFSYRREVCAQNVWNPVL
jgi:hypothetical protein